MSLAWARRPMLAAGVVLGLVAVVLLAPVERWRTGRPPVPPLPLEAGGPAVPTTRLWIDTDAACGVHDRADSDDCLAVLALLRAPSVHVVGISGTAGNADAASTHDTLRALLARLEQPPPLFAGGASDAAELALRRALRGGPLTVVALGPLSNVARALNGAPELRRNVSRLVAVMGRRPGHVFHPSEGNGRGMLLGHGPIFSDFNVRQDPRAAAEVLAMDLPVTLIPYDAARSVQLHAGDLSRLARTGPAGAWVAARSRGWLDYWNTVVGSPGFYPFDLLAAAYVIAPEAFHCAALSAWVTPASDLLGWLYAPTSVLVGLPEERPSVVRGEHRVLYCPAGRDLSEQARSLLSHRT